VPTNDTTLDYNTDARQYTFDYYNAMGGTPNPYSENRMEAAPNARVLEIDVTKEDAELIMDFLYNLTKIIIRECFEIDED